MTARVNASMKPDEPGPLKDKKAKAELSAKYMPVALCSEIAQDARGRVVAERARLHRRNVATFLTVSALLAPLAVASVWVLGNVEHSTSGNPDIVIEVQSGWTAAQVEHVTVMPAA